jgi:hypothetical protein
MLKIKKLGNKGNASIEMIPVIAIFLLLVNFGLGFFGVIHSGILNSIAARNYAFETFRNRANLNYLRDESSGSSSYNFGENPYYANANFRYHATVQEGAAQNQWIATQRPLKFTDVNTGMDPISNSNDHNQIVRSMSSEDKKTSEYFTGQSAQDGQDGVSPVWIMTSYGICLNTTCEGS